MHTTLPLPVESELMSKCDLCSYFSSLSLISTPSSTVIPPYTSSISSSSSSFLSSTANCLTLPCNHSICESCQNLYQYLIQFYSISNLYCPLCNGQDQISLPLHLFEKKLSSTVSASTKLCEHCNVDFVSIYCHNCAIHLCSGCWNTIHCSKIMQKHEKSCYLSDNEGAKFPFYSLIDQLYEQQYLNTHCRVHEEETEDLYCFDCQVKICTQCHKFIHYHHASGNIRNMTERYRSDCYQQFEKIVAHYQQVEKVLQSAAQYLLPPSNWINDIFQDMYHHFNTLYRQLENRREYLLHSADTLAESRYELLSRQRSTLTNIHLNSLQVLEKVHRYLPTLNIDSNAERDRSYRDYQQLIGDLQSILEVDVTENIGTIHDDRDISFQYSSSLPELLYTYGELLIAEEPWLELVPFQELHEDFSHKDPYRTPTKGIPTSLSPAMSHDHVKEEFQTRRSILCSLVDQVEAIITQSNSINRHIELIMKGIGYHPPKDARQQQIGELRRSLTIDQSFSSPQKLIDQRELPVNIKQLPTLTSLTLSQFESGEDDNSDPFDSSPEDDDKTSKGIISRGIHRIGMNALSSTKYDINEHFEYLSRILLLRFENLKILVTKIVEKKSSYFQRHYPQIQTYRSDLFFHLLHLLRFLSSSIESLLPNTRAIKSFFEKGDIMFGDTVFRDYSTSISRVLPRLLIPYDISIFISDHGTVGGPPSPIDLKVKRTHGGQGTGIELTWRDGPKVKSEEDSTNTIDYYIIQSAVYQETTSSDELHLIPKYSLVQPFQDITRIPRDISSCVIDIRDHPNSLILFRIQSVSLTGVSGPHSMSISINTPTVFHPIFEYSGHPFDTNGLIYWLGTKNSEVYQNPYLAKEVTLAASTLQGSLHVLVNHNLENSNSGITLCMTHNKVQSWFSIDLGPDRYLQIHAYCLRSGRGENYKLRNWELHGKVHKTDKKWHILKRHKNCTDLKETSYSTAGWEIKSHLHHLQSQSSIEDQHSESPPPKHPGNRGKGPTKQTTTPSSLVMDSIEISSVYSPATSPSDVTPSSPFIPQPLAYRYFRIIQTGLNSSGDHHLVCNGMEFYGILLNQPVS